MEKIDLSFYKNHIVYFSFFDIYFKEYNIKKEEFLSKIGVTPSSYRKCRNGQLKIGDIIVEQIAGEIGYKVPNKKFINKFQELVNRIYNDVYYKIYDNYENDLINLDKLLSDKYLLEPIIKLLKVFLLTNSNKSLNIIQSQNKVLYDEIKKYEKFFYGDLLEIYEIVYLANEEHINNHYLVKKYNSALPYYSLSTRSYLEYKYIECMYYIDKAKQFLYNDSNVNRIYYLNNTLMACLLEIGNYEECYQITKKQLLSLASIELNNEFIKRTSNKNKILALLGMEKYQSIIDILGNQTKISRTELVSLLVVNLKIDKINNTKRSEVVLNNIKESDFDEDFLYVIELIIQYLNKPNDKLYNKIKSYPHISRCFYIILKNIVTK